MPAQIRIPEQNIVLLVGRLTRDPNVSFTQKGQAVCRCDIAVNRRYFDKTINDWKEDAVFVPIVIWGAAAERCKDRVKKGTPISAEARTIAEKLQGVVLPFTKTVNAEGVVFGSVNKADIYKALIALGHKITKDAVELSMPIKALGETEVSIYLKPTVSAKIKVQINPLTQVEEKIADAKAEAK